MPIVFVHGVNNREDAKYIDNENSRNGFLREIVAPVLGLASDGVTILSPYWGKDAVTFAWKQAVLPDPSAGYQAFGPGKDPWIIDQALEISARSDPTKGFVEFARRDFAGAVDALFSASLAAAPDEASARSIAGGYPAAVQYAKDNPNPAWLAQVTDDNFVDVLNSNIRKGPKSFGAGAILDHLKEGASRLVQALPDASSALLVRMGRRNLNAMVTRFAGDIFVYLSKRQTQASPGPIVATVLDALRQAVAAKTAADDKLIVIAHSFGGEIVYDIATTFAPEIRIDTLITVGSQVGLFEEMKVYLASRPDLPPDPLPGQLRGKLAKPAAIGRWINVFDTNDILSYRISPIFDDVTDFVYDTGYSTLQAHGGYFMRPSFYTRLADRLKQP